MNVPVIVITCALFMIIVEWRVAGRRWQKVSGWWTRAFILNGAQIAVAYLGVRTWDRWFHQNRPWSLEASDLTGALIGYLVITFIYYWWHRARHRSDFLWRWLHQVHHSPSRIEIATSFYKHPLEVLLNGLLSSAILYLLLGLSVQCATYAVMLTAFAELFYHWNVSTPHWLGYLIQRPESHCWHHLRGAHRGNYADLPLWDMLFGTFYNPRGKQFECGFDLAQERQIRHMLLGKALSREAKP